MANKYLGRAEEVWDDALHRVRSFQDDSKQYVRKNPSKAVFTALGIGFVLRLISVVRVGRQRSLVRHG
jgi:hypothetical protein